MDFMNDTKHDMEMEKFEDLENHWENFNNTWWRKSQTLELYGETRRMDEHLRKLDNLQARINDTKETIGMNSTYNQLLYDRFEYLQSVKLDQNIPKLVPNATNVNIRNTFVDKYVSILTDFGSQNVNYFLNPE